MSDGILSFLINNQKPDVTSKAIKSIEQNPELLSQVADDPVASSIIESIRKNPVLRKKILGRSPELATSFTNLEKKLLDKKFLEKRDLLMGESEAFLKDLAQQRQSSESKRRLFDAFRQEMLRQTRLARKPVSASDVLAGLHSRGMDVKPIAEEASSLVEEGRKKPGLSLIHGNVNTARLKNILNTLKSRAEVEGSRAESLGGLEAQAHRIKEALGKRSGLSLLGDTSIAEETDYRPTHVLRERDLNISEYIAELENKLEEADDPEMTEDEKKWNRPGNLLKYFIEFSSDK